VCVYVCVCCCVMWIGCPCVADEVFLVSGLKADVGRNSYASVRIIYMYII
jgi:hypothetical protein